MYDHEQVATHFAAAKEHLSALFSNNNEDFDGEAFEDLLASIKDAVDNLGIDLDYISGNHFECFSEFVLDYAEHHSVSGETNITALQEKLDALEDDARNDGDAQDFLQPVSQFIMELAALVYPQFNVEDEDLLSELSIFDFSEGIGEVDDDADGFDHDFDD